MIVWLKIMSDTNTRMAGPVRPDDDQRYPKVSARERFDRSGFALIPGMVDLRELKGITAWARSLDLEYELAADKDIAGASV